METLFTATITKIKASAGYTTWRKIFSLQEIEDTTSVKWVLGTTLFSYYITFSYWMSTPAMTFHSLATGRETCWAYFQGCTRWIFLEGLPYGYSQNEFYMVLFGIMILTVFWMARGEWVLAQMTMVPLFVWHVLGALVLSNANFGNYDYYVLLFGAITLFFPHKEFFIKLLLPLFYFLASTIKIHEGWILGSYFSALNTGIPVFPNWSIPVWTNIVIFMQITGAWFLYAKNTYVQRLALLYFVTFHLYSGILVQYHYPSIVLPNLLIMFGMFHRRISIPVDKKAIAGWFLVAVLFFGQTFSHIIPGDTKLSLEGNYYGLFMFEANHQCVSTMDVQFKDGTQTKKVIKSGNARNRCDPWTALQGIQFYCKRDPKVKTIAWTFDHSIDGGAFYRIVVEKDACALTYKPFSHNSWIKLDEEKPRVIGYPLKNWYE